MRERWINKSRLQGLAAALLAGGWFIAAALIPEGFHYVRAGGFLLLAVALYAYLGFGCGEKNAISLKALFSGMWLGTIGLADLKLLGYQKPWALETWLVLGGAFLAFHLGFYVMESLGIQPLERLKDRQTGRLSFRMEESRLFPVCVVTTLIGLGCFTINILIRGYIPFFVTDEMMAYYDFYTRFNIFTVASTAGAGLCYYTLKTQKLSRPKQVFLVLAILYEVVAMPLLSVSRGTMMIAILTLTAAIVMLSRHKLPVFLVCMAVAFGLYEVGSAARHLSNEYLDYVFQPKVLNVPAESEASPPESALPEEPSQAAPAEPSTSAPAEAPEQAPAETAPQGISLSPRAAFLYGYLTVSHDNFNEAVTRHTGYTYGLRQLQAFTVVLRFPGLKEKLESLEFYQVGESLNTGNLITDAYYDFGPLGCCVFLFLWACVFSVIEQYARRSGGPCAMIALGVAMIPVVLCFFESWTSYFTFWLLWGTDLLLFFALCLHINKEDPGRETE